RAGRAHGPRGGRHAHRAAAGAAGRLLPAHDGGGPVRRGLQLPDPVGLPGRVLLGAGHLRGRGRRDRAVGRLHPQARLLRRAGRARGGQRPRRASRAAPLTAAQLTRYPPSTGISAPLTIEAASEASHTATSETSWGWAKRSLGMRASIGAALSG